MPPEQKPPEPIVPPAVTPKDHFRRGPHRQAHEKWTDTPAATAAMESALAEYVDGLGDAGNEFFCTSLYNRLQGAKAVLGILKRLHLPDEVPKIEPLRNLRPPS
jgi:hypothetical protein